MTDTATSAAMHAASLDRTDHPPRQSLVPLVTLLGTTGSADGYLLELASRLAFPAKPRTHAEVADWSSASRSAHGELSLDERGRRVTVDGIDVNLTRLEFQLLLTLVNRHDHVLSRGALLRDVWQRSMQNRTRTVDTHVKRLRDKLGRAGSYIQTVRGIGYRFSERVAPKDARRKFIPRGPTVSSVPIDAVGARP